MGKYDMGPIKLAEGNDSICRQSIVNHLEML